MKIIQTNQKLKLKVLYMYVFIIKSAVLSRIFRALRRV